MTLFSYRWWCGAAVCWTGVSAALAAPEPHPKRKDRLVEVRDGIRVEYSPGQETLVGPLAVELEAWNREHARRMEALEAHEAEPLLLSPSDFRAHRDEILRQVAVEIGLDAPTAQQAQSFDARLSDYEMLEQKQRMVAALMLSMSHTTEAAIWTKEEVAKRLKDGEPMPGFSFDVAKGEATYTFTLSPTFEASADEQAYREELERRGLDHDFNYRTEAPGAVALSAHCLSHAATRRCNRAVSQCRSDRWSAWPSIG